MSAFASSHDGRPTSRAQECASSSWKPACIRGSLLRMAIFFYPPETIVEMGISDSEVYKALFVDLRAFQSRNFWVGTSMTAILWQCSHCFCRPCSATLRRARPLPQLQEELAR